MSDSNYSGSGRSRGRGQSRGRNARTDNTGRSGTARRSAASAHRGGKRGHSGGSFTKIAAAGVILIAAIAVAAGVVKNMDRLTGQKATEAEMTMEPETELASRVSVDGVDITGMSREEAKDAILVNYPWDMSIVYGDKTYSVTDLMAVRVDELLEEIFKGEPKESYTLNTSGLEEQAEKEAAAAAALWNVSPKNGSISGYDAATDKFVFSGAEQGVAIDQEKLSADIVRALEQKNFSAKIQAKADVKEPEISEAAAKEQYKTVSSVTTNTTANSKRNTNVKLACMAINGTVLQPGEEFSFNETVGQRTVEKGYQGAAAYNNGEVVEEIGGGVCQVSSTLYNAVVKAGLKTTVRRSHTFEPSYVTPGTDATISWGGPDYKFVNNSNAAIGLRASYSNQTCTVSIYAIPILEEGVTYSLKSEKKKDLGVPAPTYEEDPTLEPGVEKVKKNGSAGSYWETRLVITRNGQVESSEIDHTTSYKGHSPIVLRNTSGTVAAPSEGEASETIEAIDSATETSAAAGPDGGSTEAPPQSTAAPTQSAAAPTQGTAPTQSAAAPPQGVVPAPGNSGTNVPVQKPTAAEQLPIPTSSGNPSGNTVGSAPGSGDTMVIAPHPGA